MKRVILHVEDDANDALLVQLAFRKLDLSAQLRAVDDGDKAMAYLSNQPPYEEKGQFPRPAFVLLDIKLPGGSGFDVLAWIRSRPDLRYLPVAILSSSTQPEDIRKAYDMGANSFIQKPSNLEGILEMVRIAHAFWAGFNHSVVSSPG
jgi:CheY-like chemotaxis protein